jgi:hypothetical protein
VGIIPGPPGQLQTESYNGTSWTAPGNLNTVRRYLQVAGTQTAALAFGGELYHQLQVQQNYNGTSWTTSPVSLCNSKKKFAGVAGTQTLALGFGGFAGGPYQMQQKNGQELDLQLRTITTS